MADLIQSAKWPGVVGVASCQGVVSHGITPSVFVLETYPQAVGLVPAVYGDLLFSDGTRSVGLRGCISRVLTGRNDGSGQTWILEISDRRWKWATGYIDGRYNQIDTNGKLIPWTIRSPTELATLCLQAMGETNYVINLPPGLTRADGANYDRYLRLGENFRQSFANPQVVWDKTPPAEALARLAEQFGCRVVYQPIADRVAVIPLGLGGPLPGGYLEVDTPSVSYPALPAGVGVAGAAVRFQLRFYLEAVGEEFDGSVVPIKQLSYAPQTAGSVQVTTVTFSPPTPPPSLALDFSWTVKGEDKSAYLSSTDTSITTIAARWAAITGQLAGQPDLNNLVTMSVAGNVLTITGKVVGQSFGVVVTQPLSPADATLQYATADVRTASPPQASWDFCPPPSFAGVLATDRLSYAEALGKARKSVWKWFRIVNRQYGTAPGANPVKPILVPWYGPLARRQQVVLQGTKVEQVVPQPRLPGGANKGNPIPNGGILPDFYNGYSRDQKAVVTGSINKLIGTVVWNPVDLRGNNNTNPTSRVYVDFDVEPIEQIVQFVDYVYRTEVTEGGYVSVKEPQLTLETGCLIQDVSTSQLVRWLNSTALGGPAPAEWVIREDLQVGVVGQYGDDGSLSGSQLLGFADAQSRAAYYLTGMAAQYQLSGGVTRQYAGIMPIDLDGVVQQVGWSVGQAGPTTTASANSEFSALIPPYPARRLPENLPPNKAAAAANAADRAFVQRLLPRPPGAAQ